MSKTIELDNGKYTIVYDETSSYPEKCLRYGKEWRDLVGSYSKIQTVIILVKKKFRNLRNFFKFRDLTGFLER